MRVKWRWTAVLLAAAAGCGEGRVIFDIDVFSFLKSANAETLPYIGPGATNIPVQTVNGLGFATSSIVDTVRLIGSVDFVNTSGTGNVDFEVYFDTVKATVYSQPFAFRVSGPVTPGATTTSPFDIPNLPDAMRPFFLASTVYVGIRAAATGTIQGTAALSALRARIVIRDQLF